MDSYTINHLWTMKNGQLPRECSYHGSEIEREFIPDGDYIIYDNQSGYVLEYRIANSGVVQVDRSTTEKEK